MLAIVDELELRHFPRSAHADTDAVRRDVERLASTFFTRDPVDVRSDTRLWLRRTDRPPLENPWIGGKPLGVYGVRRLRGLRPKMGPEVTVFFQDLQWISFTADVAAVLNYFTELGEAHREIYVVSGDWYRCMTVTHDGEVLLLRPLDLTPQGPPKVESPGDDTAAGRAPANAVDRAVR